MDKSNKRKTSLDYEIDLANLEKYVINPQKEVERQAAREKKEDMKIGLLKGFITCIPLLIGFGVFLATDTVILLLIGMFITGGITITKGVVDMVNNSNEPDEIPTNNPKIVKINNEVETDEPELEKVVMERPEDFYTPLYGAMVATNNGLSNEESSVNMNIVGSDIKAETMKDIVNSIKIYYKAYNLPPLKIKDFEWKIFFDSTFEIFTKKNIEEDYYERIYFIVKMTLARSLVNNENELNIRDFVNELHYLECIDIKEKEVKDLEKKILDQLPGTKVVKGTPSIKVVEGSTSKKTVKEAQGKKTSDQVPGAKVIDFKKANAQKGKRR